MKELLCRPLPWGFLSGLALLAALLVPAGGSGMLFWGFVGLSVLSAVLTVWFAGTEEA